MDFRASHKCDDKPFHKVIKVHESISGFTAIHEKSISDWIWKLTSLFIAHETKNTDAHMRTRKNPNKWNIKKINIYKLGLKSIKNIFVYDMHVQSLEQPKYDVTCEDTGKKWVTSLLLLVITVVFYIRVFYIQGFIEKHYRQKILVVFTTNCWFSHYTGSSGYPCFIGQSRHFIITYHKLSIFPLRR